MWRVSTRKQTTEAPQVSAAPVAAPRTIKSVGRPYASLGVTPLKGRGFVFTLTDSLARDVTTPTIPLESVARALEGSAVMFRNGGHSVEMTPVDDMVKIRCNGPGGPAIEGIFQASDLEYAMKASAAPTRSDFAFRR